MWVVLSMLALCVIAGLAAGFFLGWLVDGVDDAIEDWP